MKLTEHLEQIQQLIQNLPSKPQVKLFSGTLNDDDLSKLKIDGAKPYVLLGTAGGPVPENRIKLEIDSVFGAFVIAKADPSTHGLSKIAMDTAVEIAQAIEKYRADNKTNPKLPVLNSIQELFSGVKNGTNLSAWQVIWTQRIALV